MKNYPLTEKYNHNWVSKNWMGPNPLWLLEELCEHMDLRPGMKVLDMGCGKGLTSVFLAKEFGVTVFANDLWISATENRQRFEEAGVADLVYPIHAEAHALPLPMTSSMRPSPLTATSISARTRCISLHLLKAGQARRSFGIVVPGLKKEFKNGYPNTLKEHWEGECSASTARAGGGIFGKRPAWSKSPRAMTWKSRKKSGCRGLNGQKKISAFRCGISECRQEQ